MEDCARRNDLLSHVRFGVRVTGATFDEASGTWTVHTAGGEEIVADVVVSAVGQLHRPRVQDRQRGWKPIGGAQPGSSRPGRDCAVMKPLAWLLCLLGGLGWSWWFSGRGREGYLGNDQEANHRQDHTIIGETFRQNRGADRVGELSGRFLGWLRQQGLIRFARLRLNRRPLWPTGSSLRWSSL
jgi:hypothetical protein